MSRAGPPSGARDLTEGPILRTLLAFAAPTLLSNILQSLNGTVNSIWVGRALGESALAATANANIVMFLVFSTVFGFGMAATVKVGQCFGARDIDSARRVFGSAIGFCGGLALVVSVGGWLGAPRLLAALGTAPEVSALALAYLRMIFVAMPATMLTAMASMGLRGAGDSRTPLLFMILTVAVDVILNPLLIIGVGPFPRLGIAGSALATAIAGVVALVAMIGYVYARDLPLRLRGAELRYLIPHRAELGYLVRKGVPMGAQMLIVSGAGLLMVGIVNREGVLATAAYGATIQLWTYVQMPAMAISAAVSAMAAQAIGAKRWDRLGAATRGGIVANVLLTGVLVGAVLLFDRAALVLFLGPDSPAVPLARHIQQLASWNFVLFGVTMVLFGTMRANGVVIAPMIILAIALYGGRLGFYFVARPWLGADAIWLAFPAGSIVSCALAIFAYRRKGWRKADLPRPSDETAEESQADAEPAGRMKPAL
jgi:putative MATE family efflux protein